MTKIKKIIIGIMLIVAAMAVFAPLALAADGSGIFGESFCPCCQYPDGWSEPCHLDDIVAMIDKILRAVLYLSFYVAVIMFLYAGFKMITAAGNPKQIQEGKDIIWYTVVGMLWAFGAWLVVNTMLGALTGKGVAEFVNKLKGFDFAP